MDKEVTEVINNPGLIEQFLEDKIPVVISFIIQVIVAALVLFIGIKIIKHLVKVIQRAFEKSRMETSVARFLAALIRYSLYVILIMAILSGFGVATGSVVAILGSAGLTIGLALQGSLANFAGGVIILITKPFVIGDYILESSTGGEGTVIDINLYCTKLRTIDNKVVMVPNGKLADSSITNITMLGERQLELIIDVAYDSDIETVKNILTERAQAMKEYLVKPDINVFLSELKDSSMAFGLRLWLKSDDYWKVKWQLTEDIKRALDANNIEIPFPQMDVTVKNS